MKFWKKGRDLPLERLVILNPAGDLGGAEKRFGEILPFIDEKFGRFKLYITARPGDAAFRVRAALRAGECFQILAAGGDGTVNECVNGYFENGRLLRDDVPLGIINLGAAGNLHRTLCELGGAYEVSVRENLYRRADLGEIIMNPGERRHYFINGATAGTAPSVTRDSHLTREGPRFLRTLKSLQRYKPARMKFRILSAGETWRGFECGLWRFMVQNGRYRGAGMNPAPRAGLEDGLFDLVIFDDMSRLKRLMESSKMYDGRIREMKGVTEFRAREAVISSGYALSIEADGDVIAVEEDCITECRFRVLPGAFPLVV